MDLSTLRTYVRDLIDEDTASFWSDADLNRYINTAYYHYWKMLIEADHPTAKQSTTLNITSDTATIALPSDYVETSLVERVFSDRTVPLKFSERKEGTNYTGAGVAETNYLPTYRFTGNNLVLEPTPQVSVTGGIKLTYFYLPTQLSADGDTPTINAIHHEMIGVRAARLAKLKEESVGQGGADVISFGLELADMEKGWEEFIERTTAQPEYVHPWGSY